MSLIIISNLKWITLSFLACLIVVHPTVSCIIAACKWFEQTDPGLFKHLSSGYDLWDLSTKTGEALY